jgi:carbonic anhydrase
MAMKDLLGGLAHFEQNVFPQERELFQSLSAQQRPEILLLACSDSRVVPSLFLQAKPGDLFVCRNAGNIAPAHGETSGGVSATIEYAVRVLNVKHIVVCGHSDCGAMKALMQREKVAHLPAVASWLRYAERAVAVVEHVHAHLCEAERLKMLIRENVTTQIANLMTHGCVAACVAAGTLKLHGWVFDIGEGKFDIYDHKENTFKPLNAMMVQSREVAHA